MVAMLYRFPWRSPLGGTFYSRTSLQKRGGGPIRSVYYERLLGARADKGSKDRRFCEP